MMEIDQKKTHFGPKRRIYKKEIKIFLALLFSNKCETGLIKSKKILSYKMSHIGLFWCFVSFSYEMPKITFKSGSLRNMPRFDGNDCFLAKHVK